MPEKLLKLRGFVGIHVYGEPCRALPSSDAKLVIFANSEQGYVTKFPRGMRHTGNGMRPALKKSCFGQDLVDAMKVTASHSETDNTALQLILLRME